MDKLIKKVLTSKAARNSAVLAAFVAAAMDDAPAKDAARKKPVEIVGTFGMPQEDFAYAVRKEDAALLDMLNEGLRRLMADPYWEELKKKYEP